jgi:hypothetical protein
MVGYTARPQISPSVTRGNLDVIFEVISPAPAYCCVSFTRVGASLCAGVGAGRGDTAGSGGSSSLHGRVYFPDRGEGKTVRVTIESPDVGTRSTVTDPDGVFIFNNLRSNTYQVTVEGGADYQT